MVTETWKSINQQEDKLFWNTYWLCRPALQFKAASCFYCETENLNISFLKKKGKEKKNQDISLCTGM